MNLTYRKKEYLAESDPRNSKRVGEAASPDTCSHPDWRNQSRNFETELSKWMITKI